MAEPADRSPSGEREAPLRGAPPGGFPTAAGSPFEPPRHRPAALRRRPLPPPPGSRPALAAELTLVLALAFAPGLLGLLILASGVSPEAGAARELGAAIAGWLFSLILSWSPVALVAFLLSRSGERRAGIGLDRFAWGVDGGVGIVMWIASFVLVWVLALLFRGLGQNPVDFLPESLPLWFRVANAVAIAVTAGVTEEVVVRGYAQTRLEQLRAPVALVVLVPTGVWAVLHLYQGPAAGLTIFFLGLMYALWYHFTRRLWPLIIAHMLFDATQLAIILALSGS